MLLRNSISNTRKFFQRTFQSFKFFIYGDSYERLPKSSPFNDHYLDCSYTPETDTLVADNIREKSVKIRGSAKNMPTANQLETEPENVSIHQKKAIKPIKKDYQIQIRERYDDYDQKNKMKGYKRDEERYYIVAQKLKEIEMMDISNVEHVLDIEEVIHYYSRLTCPAYLDIIDKFFMDIYAESFGSSSTTRRLNSRLRRLPPV